MDLANEICNLTIEDDEELVSFDVKALYPNVPIPKAIEILEIWLNKQQIDRDKGRMYINMTKVCMNQTIFQFKGKFYKQNFGTSMGNPLSCFVANIFMANL